MLRFNHHQHFLIMIFLFIITPFCLSNQTIKLATGEWPPFIGEKLPHYGSATHVTVKAFNKAGYSVEVKFYPWNRVYALTKNQVADVTILWKKTKERQQVFYFSEPITHTKNVIFYNTNRPIIWKTFKDLAGTHIGGTENYGYALIMKHAAATYGFNYDDSPNDITGLKKLRLGRIDGFVCAIAVCSWLLENHAELKPDAFSYSQAGVDGIHAGYLMISKQHPQAFKILNLFNQSIEELKTTK